MSEEWRRKMFVSLLLVSTLLVSAVYYGLCYRRFCNEFAPRDKVREELRRRAVALRQAFMREEDLQKIIWHEKDASKIRLARQELESQKFETAKLKKSFWRAARLAYQMGRIIFKVRSYGECLPRDTAMPSRLRRT